MILENSTLVYYIPLKTIKCILLNFVTCIWFRSVVEMWKKVIFFHYSHVGTYIPKTNCATLKQEYSIALGQKYFCFQDTNFPFGTCFPIQPQCYCSNSVLAWPCFSFLFILLYLLQSLTILQFLSVDRSLHEVFKKVCQLVQQISSLLDIGGYFHIYFTEQSLTKVTGMGMLQTPKSSL